MLGATGAVVSMVTFSAADAALVMPDTASVAVAVKLWAPFGKAAVVYVQAPLAFAVARAEQRRTVEDIHRAVGHMPCRSASA